MDGWKAGLEDVVAARSAICAVDGEAGRLYYRGYEIGELAGSVPFEDVTALLWEGELPSPGAAAAFRARLRAARGLPAPVLALLRALPPDAHPLDALRTAVSLAATHDPDTRAGGREADLRKAARLLSLVPETVAAWQRIRTGRAPVPARPDLGHAAHVLYLLEGREPAPEVARVLDLALTLHADHELNASTFAARVAVATLADLHAAVVGAIATLKGPRHGGANEDVLRMLQEIGSADRVPSFIREVKQSGGEVRLMGFGHRVYKNYDPRAKVIKLMADKVFEVTGRNPLLDIALELERIALSDEYFVKRRLYPNVDFYSGLIYQAIGLPTAAFTVVFAIPRTSGWLAPWGELLEDPEEKIARPRQVYLGEGERSFVPMERR
ncbi:MAG TPA: citrate/2-methylcitrate synthase [Methylomirabilota bacterium]|nr:citrate/2-methylcitrate synthase [Methylomirabilota bacterium]